MTLEHGLVLRCVWCRQEQRLVLPERHNRVMADMQLHLMTGGFSGAMPPGFGYTPAVGTSSNIGKSECCDAQIEGWLFGYEEATDAGSTDP